MTETPFDPIDVPIEEWQVREILAGIADVEAGNVVSHGCVSKWLRSWGKLSEGDAPR